MKLLVILSMLLAASAGFAQTPGAPELANFTPGTWMSTAGRVGVELQSVNRGVVTGRWLDVDGRVYPIGAQWEGGAAASGHFENGIFRMTTPAGNRWELRLSTDGS